MRYVVSTTHQSVKRLPTIFNMHHRARPATATRKTLPMDRRGVRRSNYKLSPILLFAVPLFVVMGSLVLLVMYSFPTVNQDTKLSLHINTQSSTTASSRVMDDFRKEFFTRYGGQEAAEGMLARGMESYGSIQVTAERMLRAAAVRRPFYVAFSGYSVTVGRGNHFHESFPLVLERILKEPLKQALGVELVVKNAAIGGIPSFPYGWCLEHFLGNNADVISWDYGMNEGNGAAVMESYLRRGMQLSKRPMFILVDSNRQRQELLRKYVDMDVVKDAIRVVHGPNLVDKAVLEKPDAERPLGFRNWDQFGAPNGCPGRSSWHPKKMEHELIGWMIAMHLIQAMERAHEIMTTNGAWKKKYAAQEESNRLAFPPPISQPPPNDEPVTQLMYGHPHNGTDKNKLVLSDISCRTSFLPALDHNRVLPSVVVSGMADMDKMSDLMVERSLELYQSGWVLDVDKVERDTKKKVENCGGLGYIDMKVALYGIPKSGPLRLWLPYEGSTTPIATNSDAAISWFDDSLLVCEANNKRKDEACRLDKDMTYTVGGVKAEKVTGVEGAGVYLRRKTCVHVEIPPNAEITRFRDIKMADASDVTANVQSRLQGTAQQAASNDNVGLLVDISIHRENVSRENGACCVSHIIWEHRQQ